MTSLTPRDITTFLDTDEEPWVNGRPAPYEVVVAPYDPAWPTTYERCAADIRSALGARVLQLEHIGSTSVPGLAAKPVIDIDLVVADTTDESSYVPALEALGYELTIREPSWYEHRCLKLHGPLVNLHVFNPDCPETVRHVLFRDHLRAHEHERAAYVEAKRSALGDHDVYEYNARKEAVVREIYQRAFAAAGLLD